MESSPGEQPGVLGGASLLKLDGARVLRREREVRQRHVLKHDPEVSRALEQARPDLRRHLWVGPTQTQTQSASSQLRCTPQEPRRIFRRASAFASGSTHCARMRPDHAVQRGQQRGGADGGGGGGDGD